MAPMKVLIVAAPPTARSLTAALAATALDAAREAGHEATLVDLRALGWGASVEPSDYGLDEHAGTVGDDAAAALERGRLAPEVREQQELLLAADALVLMFPLWWSGMPARLKGWVDRVFTQGFAYALADADGNPRKYGDGALAGRRGLVIVSTGDRPTSYRDRGVNAGLEDVLFPVTHGLLWYTGIAPLPLCELPGVDSPAWMGDDAAHRLVRERIAGLEHDAPIPYRRLLDDYDGDRMLRGDLAPGRTGLAVHRRDG